MRAALQSPSERSNPCAGALSFEMPTLVFYEHRKPRHHKTNYLGKSSVGSEGPCGSQGDGALSGCRTARAPACVVTTAALRLRYTKQVLRLPKATSDPHRLCQRSCLAHRRHSVPAALAQTSRVRAQMPPATLSALFG